MTVVAWAMFVSGAGIAAFNAYLSFVRYPLHRLRGRSREQYRFVSGVPVLGTVLLVAGWLLLPATPWLTAIAAACLLADTGGPHWFLGVVLYQRLLRQS